MKKLFCIFSLLFLSFICYAQQTTNSWEAFQQIRQETRDAFLAYRDSIEKEYAEYLSQTWKEYEIQKGLSPFKEPKPDTIPMIPLQTDREYMVVDADTVIKGIVDTGQYPEILFEVKESQDSVYPNPLTIPFYGNRFELFHDVKGGTLKRTSEKEVSNLWKSFSNPAVTNLIADLYKIKKEKNLNDWAFYQLVDKTTQEMKQFEGINARMVFRHFILFKCGYNIRLGRVNNSLVLLIAFEGTVYNRQYIEDKSPKFYLFTDREEAVSGKVYTVPFIKEEAGRPLNLKLTEDIQLGYTPVHIKRSWKEYTIETTINKERIDFFRHYPQTELQVFADAPVDKCFEQEVISQFSDYIKGKDNLFSLRLFLHFTQSAFKYAHDYDQFEEEKYFFPEETFYYDSSDCEDRAIFFSFLVRKLLKKEIVLLNYPDHVSTGVILSQQFIGFHIHTKEKKYLYCDPTYDNADIGQCPDKYKNIHPEVINTQIY